MVYQPSFQNNNCIIVNYQIFFELFHKPLALYWKIYYLCMVTSQQTEIWLHLIKRITHWYTGSYYPPPISSVTYCNVEATVSNKAHIHALPHKVYTYCSRAFLVMFLALPLLSPVATTSKFENRKARFPKSISIKLCINNYYKDCKYSLYWC